MRSLRGLVAILRSMWADSSWIYDIVVRGNLEVLRKGWRMTDCTTEGCDNVARVIVRRPTLEIPIGLDGVVTLNEISVSVRKGDRVTVPGTEREVCEDCKDFMIAVFGWQLAGLTQRLESVV